MLYFGWCFLIRLFSRSSASVSVFVTIMLTEAIRAIRFRGLGIMVGFLEITRHPFFEIFCLPDIDDRHLLHQRKGNSRDRPGGQ